MTSRWVGVVRVALGAVAFAAVAVAFVQTWDRSQGLELPSWPSLMGAGALIAVGLYCGAQGWIYLLKQGDPRRLAATFYLSQIGKYVPGAIWQPAGQLTMAVAAGIPAALASTAVAVYMLTLIAAGGTVGAFLSVFGHLSGPARAAPFLGLIPIVLLNRMWMTASLDRVHRRFEWIPGGNSVPSQRAIFASYAWGIVVMLTTGGAFFVLAATISSEISLVTAVPAFAFAWTIGFLAIPVPAGLGIREAVLIGTLGADPAAALAASVFYRLLSIIVEVAAVLVSRIGARRHPVEE